MDNDGADGVTMLSMIHGDVGGDVGDHVGDGAPGIFTATRGKNMGSQQLNGTFLPSVPRPGMLFPRNVTPCEARAMRGFGDDEDGNDDDADRGEDDDDDDDDDDIDGCTCDEDEDGEYEKYDNDDTYDAD